MKKIWLLLIDYADGSTGCYGFAVSSLECAFFLAFFKPSGFRWTLGPWSRRVVPLGSYSDVSQFDFEWWE